MISKISDTKSQDLSATLSSGNIFADLGLPNPEEMLVKAELSKQIYICLQERQLTEDTATNILGLEAAHAAALIAGKPSNLSIEQLFQALNALDCDVEIIIKNKANSQEKSHIKVFA
jgi:predicted XRE-type DNA-binding protein